MSQHGSSSREFLRILLPVAILVVGFGGYWILAAQREMPVRAVTENAAPLVDVVTVELDRQGLDIETDGVVVPYREIALSAEVAGRIQFKAPECRTGSYVTRGSLLIEIDPRDYELEVSRLKKELEQASVTLQELDVELKNNAAMIALADEEVELQRKDLARQLKLAESRIATDSQLDEAKRQELASRNALQSVRNMTSLLSTRRARLASAMELVQSQLSKAEIDLARATIRAPIDGVIVGDMVEQDAFVQKGTALVTIEDTSKVEVKCNLQMDELFWLWQQPQATLEAATAPLSNAAADRYELPRTPVTVIYSLAGREYSWQGVLARYDGMGLDDRTRMAPCRVVVDRPLDVRIAGSDASAVHGPPALVRGMYVTVQVHARPQASLLRIPERAIRPGRVVWRVRDGRLQIIPGVTIAQLIGDTALVDAGSTQLAAGDQIVISPLAGAVDGMLVRERGSP